MTPIVNGLTDEYSDSILFLQLNANSDGEALFEQLTLPGHPSIVIFDESKQEIYRGFGIIGEDVLRTEIQTLISPED